MFGKEIKEAKYLDHFSNSSYEASFQETTRMPPHNKLVCMSMSGNK